MKKFIALLLTAIVAASAAMTASAADVTGRLAEIEVEQISVAPKIDGKFSEEEWGNKPLSVITKENRDPYLSLCASDAAWLTNDELLPNDMKTYMRWDEEYFYYCSVIDTKATYNAATPGNEGSVWQGTSFIWQIISDKAITDSITKTIVGLNNDGQILWNTETAEAGTSVETGAFTPAYDKIAIVREGNTTVYEVAFKWETIMPQGAKLSVADEFVFYSLYMPAIDDTANPVDVAVGGISDEGKYLYWNVTLTEEVVPETEAETEAEVVVEDVAAPQTFDAGVIAAVAAIVSAAGYAISKKH
jgi:hypothetical protein